MFNKKTTVFLTTVFVLSFFCCKKKEVPVPPSPVVLAKILVTDITVPEGDEQHVVQLEIKASGERKDAVTFSYETRNGTAEAENDYVPVWGNLNFPIGNDDMVITIDIEIIADLITEDDNSFEVHFFNIENAEFDKNFITVTLLNDDEPHDTFPGYVTPLEYENMTLVWHDEFNIAFYQSNWVHAIGTGCPDLCGWGNNELQYYKPENTKVGNGLLTITAEEENFSGSDYTSSRILSKDKFEFKYGRVDIRAKLPKGKGIWPALWMLGANIDEVGWPACGEVDIMELRGSVPWKVSGTLHYKNANNNAQNTGAQTFLLFGGEIFNDEFHVFSIDWDEEHIAWYVDDHKYNEELFSDLNLGNKPNPFLKEFYFLMNIAVGGNFDGNPDSTTEFPQKMEVDYIRIFQEN